MSEVNTVKNFQDSFRVATTANKGPVIYSQIFKAMEAGQNGYAHGDFVREQIQAGINDGSISVAYGVLNSGDQIVSTFSGLENEPELEDGQTVEPVYF